MKTSFLILCLISISCLTAAQFQTNLSNVQTVSDIHRLANGKYSHSVARHAGKPARYYNPFQNDRDAREAKLLAGSKKPLQTNHIVFHFDQANGFNDLLCVNADTMFLSNYNMNWVNSTTLEADMPAGYYQLFCSMDGFIVQRYIFDGHFLVYTDMDTTILSSSANHQIRLVALDEYGDTLQGQSGDSGDGFGVNVEFDEPSKVPYSSYCYSGFVPDSIMVSDIPPNMKILMNRIFVTKKKLYQQYSITYPVLSGVTSDTALTSDPSEMKHSMQILNSAPSGKDFYLAWGYGPVSNDSLTGSVDTFVGAFLWDDYPSSETDSVILYLNQSPVDSNKSFFATFIDHLGLNPMSTTHMTDIMTPITYLYKTNDLIFSTQGNYPPVESDYRISPGEAVTVGNTAPFNVTWQVNKPGQPFIDIYSHFRGQSNERRYVDVPLCTYQIWDENIMIYQDSARNSFEIYYYTPGTGIYSVILNDSNYLFYGKQGFLQTTLTFDLANPTDACSPTMMAFKVQQGDNVSPEIVRGYPAKVSFTAADWEYTPSYQRIYHSLADVQLFYKNYDETTWTSLPVNSIPAKLDSTCGMPYEADLTPVMNSYSDSALIDLMVMLMDSVGNTTSQNLHPAFLLRDVIAGTGHKTIAGDFTIYPNPASDHIFLETGEGYFMVTLYSPEGKVLIEQSDKKEIDVSGLTPGIYLVRLTDSNGLNGRYGKFIKVTDGK
ncbi:MAG: T9SS type A sorting domain-containing protein [Bacteroidetes bacterium]|nr:T9SS type A sorting domain-containing protein [Bacteroidota bacterium]